MSWVWGSVVLACGISAGLGFLITNSFSDITGTRMAAVAAGGILAMLTNSLIPFSYERGGYLAGIGTVIGFGVGLFM